MSCQHEWTESIRCAKCGQAIESRIAVGRLLDEALTLLNDGHELWHEWRSVDITENDDRWANFTNRAHAHHDAVCAYLAKQVRR